MKRIASLTVTFVLVSHSHLAFGDPSGTVTKFINEPVSLFSYGLDRLERKLDIYAKSSLFLVNGVTAPYNVGGVSFDWDKNRIGIHVTRFTKAGEEPEKLEEECKNSINTLRRLGNVDPASGKIAGLMKRSYYASEFFPTGYSLKAFTDEDAVNLDSIISLEVRIWNLTTFKQLECSAPLYGTGYSILKSP